MLKQKDIKWVYSFFIAILSVTIVLLITNTFPGGKYNILTDADLGYQFATFGSLISGKILKASNLFYSFHVGMGNNIALLIAFYFLNPFSIVFFFVKDILLATTLILLLKVGAAAAFFQLFCRQVLNKSNCSSVFFSLAYSAGAFYFYVFHMNVLYDGVYMLPVILILVDKMYKDKNPIYLSIGYIFLFCENFYCTFIVGLASFLFFIFLFIKNNCEKKFIYFYIITVITGFLISSFILFPYIYVIFSSAKTCGEFNYIAPTFLEVIAAFLPGKERVLFDSTPVLYSGLLTVVFFIVFFFDKENSKKSKIAFGIIIALLVISFFVKPLYFALHMFNNPDGYMGRYAFLISFIMCLIAVIESDNIINKLKKGRVIVYFALICMIVELIYSAFCMSKSYQKDDIAYYNYSKEEAMQVASILNETDDDVYRILYLNSDNINLSCLYDFMYLSSYSSAGSNKQYSLLNNLGFARSANLLREFGSTDIIRSLFDVKYIVTGADLTEKTNLSFEKNDNCLAIGYMVKDYIKDVDLEEGNVFENINSLIYGISGMENAFKLVDDTTVVPVNLAINMDDGYLTLVKENEDAYARFVAIAPKNKKVYSYFDNIYESNVWGLSPRIVSKADNIRYRKFESHCSDPHILLMDEAEDFYYNDIVFDDYSDKEVSFDNILFYYCDNDLSYEIYNEVKDNQFLVEEFEDGYVKGKVKATKDKNILFFTIPYENGWIVYVDGNKENIIPLVDENFIGVELEEGEHTIELKFNAPLSNLGLCLTIVGIILLIIQIIFFRKEIRKS